MKYIHYDFVFIPIKTMNVPVNSEFAKNLYYLNDDSIDLTCYDRFHILYFKDSDTCNGEYNILTKIEKKKESWKFPHFDIGPYRGLDSVLRVYYGCDIENVFSIFKIRNTFSIAVCIYVNNHSSNNFIDSKLIENALYNDTIVPLDTHLLKYNNTKLFDPRLLADKYKNIKKTYIIFSLLRYSNLLNDIQTVIVNISINCLLLRRNI